MLLNKGTEIKSFLNHMCIIVTDHDVNDVNLYCIVDYLIIDACCVLIKVETQLLPYTHHHLVVPTTAVWYRCRTIQSHHYRFSERSGIYLHLQIDYKTLKFFY